MAENTEYQLKQALFNAADNVYDPNVRPVMKVSTKTPITFAVTLRELIELSVMEQYIHIVLEMWLGWEDEFIRWNDTEYSNISSIYLTSDDIIWRPFVILHNIKEQERIEYSLPNYEIQSNGSIQTMILWASKSQCSADVYQFPMETISCQLNFMTWGVDPNNVIVTMKDKGSSSSTYKNNAEWTLASAEHNKNAKKGHVAWNMFLNLSFQRRPTFYIFNVIIPNMLIIFSCGLQFLVPMDSGERVSLSVTFLLAITVLLLVVADLLPKSSIKVPALSTYFGVASILSSVCVVFTVLSSYAYHHDPRKRPGPFVRRLLLRNLSKMLRIDTRFRRVSHKQESKGPAQGDSELKRVNQPEGEGDNTSQKSSTSTTMDEVAEDWHEISLVIDYASMIIYFLIAIIMTIWFLINITT